MEWVLFPQMEPLMVLNQLCGFSSSALYPHQLFVTGNQKACNCDPALKFTFISHWSILPFSVFCLFVFLISTLLSHHFPFNRYKSGLTNVAKPQICFYLSPQRRFSLLLCLCLLSHAVNPPVESFWKDTCLKTSQWRQGVCDHSVSLRNLSLYSSWSEFQ